MVRLFLSYSLSRRGPAMFLFEKEYCLSLSSCDEISAEITKFCETQHTDEKDVLRYRLSAEESLLNWLDKGCEGRQVRLKAGKKLISAYIMIEMDGPPVDPYMEQSEKIGEFCNVILMNLNLKPAYAYTNGRNSLYYRLRKKSMPQIQTLCIVAALSILVGIFGVLLIPDGIRSMILESILNPIYDTFFNILGCIAGPMIFLSVAWGIYGVIFQ